MTGVVEFPWVSCDYVRMDPKEVGSRIRAGRQRRGWSREELAQKLGSRVTTRTIDNWENGRSRPRDYAGALVHLLGIELDGVGSIDVPVEVDGETLVVTIPVDGELTDEQRRVAEESARAAAVAALRVLRSGQHDTNR